MLPRGWSLSDAGSLTVKTYQMCASDRQFVFYPSTRVLSPSSHGIPPALERHKQLRSLSSTTDTGDAPRSVNIYSLTSRALFNEVTTNTWHGPLSHSVGYRRLPASAVVCRRRPSSAVVCRRLPSSVVVCRRLPSSAVVCRRLPSSPVVSRRLPSSPVVSRRLPSSPVVSRRLPSSPVVSRRLPSSPVVSRRLPSSPVVSRRLPSSPVPGGTSSLRYCSPYRQTHAIRTRFIVYMRRSDQHSACLRTRRAEGVDRRRDIVNLSGTYI